MQVRNSHNVRSASGLPPHKQEKTFHNTAPLEESVRSSYCSPLDASRTALLIVDVQPEYWSECPAVRKDFPDFPSRVSSLIQNCRQQNLKRIIWVRASYDYDHSPWLHQFTRIHRGRIPPVVKPSSRWEDFAAPVEGELVLAKTSWSSTSGGTGLLDILENDGIETVLVCGLITSVCVQHSAFGVFEAGYRTILVMDACADRGLERHEAALALYGDYMYELRTVDSLYQELEEHTPIKAVSLCFDECIAANQHGFVIKSQSDGSLTCATSCDDSISMSSGAYDD
ncbi:hypothetical protein ACHAWX_003529 [Stephanocyclus meneghinianus]